MKLTGKTAIVTGGSRDIGRAISVKLASYGANVVINYFGSKENAEETLKLVEAAGGKGIISRADMTKEAEVAAMVKSTQDAFGPKIHILVNNAGGLVARKTLEEMDLAFWNKVMDLNLTSIFLAHKLVVPHMPSGGTIVNLASQAGRDGGGGGASAYSTSKGAVMTFTRAMAKELGPKGIRVNALCPGMIATTFHDMFTKDAIRDKVASITPLRREGQANEIADLVGYLANGEASFITGANIDINGGLFFS